MLIGRVLVLGVGNAQQQIDCENTYTVSAGQNQTIDCETGTATLTGQTNANTYEWITPTNQLISQSLQISATEEGIYTFVGIGDENCRVEDQVAVNPCIDCSEPTIDYLSIINSTTDQVIGRLEDGGFINIFDYPGGLNLDAEVISCPAEVGSVRFVMTGDGTHSRTESKAPYAFAGDGNGDYRDYFFTPGDYTLTITPYSQSGANGTAGTPLVINFTVINQEIDPCEILPTLEITGNPILNCLSPETTLTASASEEGIYTWTGPSGFSANTATITVSLPGIYETTFRSTIGCEVEKAIVVSIEEFPTLTVNKSSDIPCNGGSVTLTASSNQSGTYSWIGPNNFTSSEPIISIDQAGGYTATFISDEGCELSRSISVIVAEEPEITFIGDPRISCDGASATLTASTVESGTFSWSGPDGFSFSGPAITVSTPGLYEVSFVSVDNCKSSKQIEVYSAEDPFVYAGEDVALSCQTFTTVLTALANEEGDFYWTGPNNFESTAQQITVNVAGEYVLYFTNAVGCENLDIVQVSPAVIPTLALPARVSIPCNEEGVGLFAEANTEGTFRWSGSDNADGGQETLYVTETGTYSVEFTSLDGCSTSAQVVVDRESYDPVVELDDTGTIYCPGSTPDMTINLRVFCGVVWTGPNGYLSRGLFPEISVAGQYNLLIRSEAGCEVNETVNIVEGEFEPVNEIPEQVFLLCGDGSATIQVRASNYDSFRWDGPDGFTSTRLSPEISTLGTYVLSMFSGTGCTKTYEVEAVISGGPYDPVTAIETETGLNCATGSTTLSVSANDYDSFSWTGPNEFTSSILTPEVSLPGVYTITFIKGAVCEASYQITVTPDPNYSPISSIPETIALDCQSAEAQIQVVADPYDAVSWTGPDGFTSTELSPVVSLTGEYSLQLSFGAFCQASATVSVISGNENYTPISAIPESVSLDCQTDEAQIQVGADPYDNVLWTGPDGFTSTELSPTVALPENTRSALHMELSVMLLLW